MTMSVAGLRRYPGVLRLDRRCDEGTLNPAQGQGRVRPAVLQHPDLRARWDHHPFPSKVGKALPNGALLLALLLALSVNPKIKLRPNVFLCLVGLLVVDAILTASIQLNHVGTDYRTFRFVEFLAGLWLLTPWWGRSDMMLFRWHLRLLYILAHLSGHWHSCCLPVRPSATAADSREFSGQWLPLRSLSMRRSRLG